MAPMDLVASILRERISHSDRKYAFLSMVFFTKERKVGKEFIDKIIFICYYEINMKKFTFKKQKKEGRFRSFQPDFTDIKLSGKVVGHITKCKVSFAIKKERTEKDPAPFKWVRLKKVFENEQAARDLVKLLEKEIQKKYDLYLFDD